MVVERKYKNDVLFMHKSKAGKHLYIFGGEGEDGRPILGEGVKSLLVNIRDLEELLGGAEWAKVSVMREDPVEEGEGGE